MEGWFFGTGTSHRVEEDELRDICNSQYNAARLSRKKVKEISKPTSTIRHRALIALALYITSELGCMSFITLLVTIITSSAVSASSLMAKYTACRKALFKEGIMHLVAEPIEAPQEGVNKQEARDYNVATKWRF